LSDLKSEVTYGAGARYVEREALDAVLEESLPIIKGPY
tara:strand:- start:70 stop:183 length:114 start_codon:yes stop_codon:yes gene_type:complete